MIKIFRHIRQSLIGSADAPPTPKGWLSGRAGRYLLYGTGEILLVVIGILIALQVNNWNESRKIRIAEKQFVEGIKADLERDRNEILRVMELSEIKIMIFDSLESRFDDLYYTDKSRLDSLLQIYFVSQQTFFPIRGTFDAAVSGNEISSFPNKAFKSRVSKLYNATYDRLKNNGDITDMRWDYLCRKYSYERLKGTLGEMDKAELQEFLGDLSYNTKQVNYYLERLDKAVAEIQEILENKY